MRLDATDRRLIDGWQRGFPLEPAPFAAVGAALGIGADEVLRRLTRLTALAVVSRLGAVVRPNSAGASTLAALAVPAERLEEVAALVNEEPGVNHNYEREHAWNLWFVVTGADRPAVQAALGRIGARTGLPVLDLPLKRAFHIDLGFPVFGPAPPRAIAPPWRPSPTGAADKRLLAAIEGGLPPTERPYQAVARVLGIAEAEVIEGLRRMLALGVVVRLGLVVRHRALGLTANAMVVWDIPEDALDAVAEDLARQSYVTLCYERERRPAWPYNLYCMVHGRDRTDVEAQIAELVARAGERARAYAVLFSQRCFRQRGARLSAA